MTPAEQATTALAIAWKARRRDRLACAQAVRAKTGLTAQTVLCWREKGHEGWHVNPHLRAGGRPPGWLLVTNEIKRSVLSS